MYYIFDGSNEIVFASYAHMINYISQFNNRLGNEVWNTFLNNVGVSANDKCVRSERTLCAQPSDLYQLRVNRIYNEDGHNLYDGLLIQDVLSWEFSWELYREYLKSRRAATSLLVYERSAYMEFRRGPVPGVHKSGLRYCYFRDFSTFQEKKVSNDPEVAKFCRGRRGKNLPDPWDDIPRNIRNRDWKKQNKYRYQWEHNVVAKVRKTYGSRVQVSGLVCRSVKEMGDCFDSNPPIFLTL